MTVGRKSGTLVLLVAVSLSSMTAHVFTVDSGRQPAGCHEHQQKGPIQSPMSYQCCIYGHDSAVVSTFTVGLAVWQGYPVTAHFELPVQLSLLPIVESLRVSSGDPPRV